MLRRFYRGWVNAIYRGEANFTLPIGIVTVVVFAPTVTILLIEQHYKTTDMFPRADIVLPWSIAFSVFFLCLGVIITFCGIRNGAYPGSLLYRLTHFADRKQR